MQVSAVLFRDQSESIDSFRLITSCLGRRPLRASWHVHAIWNSRNWSRSAIVVVLVSIVSVVVAVVVVAIWSTSVAIMVWLVIMWHWALLELWSLLWESTHLLLH